MITLAAFIQGLLIRSRGRIRLSRTLKKGSQREGNGIGNVSQTGQIHTVLKIGLLDET